MSIRPASLAGALLTLALLVSYPLPGQVETARISGTVTDSTGAVIPGAEVTVVALQTNRTFRTQTSVNGRYEAPNLPPGEYQVTVEAEGFKRTIRSGITLEVRQTAGIDIELEIGQITESVSVTADAPLLTTTEAAQGEVISNKQIVDFPLNGRDYLKLALLTTGAMQSNTGRRNSFSASGMRPSQNNIMLDGIDNNNLQSATHGRRSEAVKIQVDAVREFKVETNAFSAEYGRSAGGVVNVTLKSGTNEVHGTVFGFLRNDALDAKNFFDPPDQPRPPFKRSQFGFAAGGPIVKNKTFIFGDYEGTLIRESRTVNNTIPTPLMRQGDFSQGEPIFDPATLDESGPKPLRSPFPNNIIPASRFDRIAAQAKDWYPEPTSASLTQNFLFNPPAREDRDRWDVRADHIFSANDNIFFRYSHDLRDIPGSPSLPPPAFGGGAGADFEHLGQNTVLAWNHIFTPTFLTSTRIGWNRIDTSRTPPVDRNINAELGLEGVDTTIPGAAIFNISGVTNLGIGPNLPNLADAQTRQFKNDTTYIRGRHTLKFGVDLSWLQNFLQNPKRALGDFQFNGRFSRNPNGNVGGEPFADFLLGIANRSRLARGVFMQLRGQFHHFYVQDEWKATRKLTLNIGMRYEVFRPWVERRDRWINFDLERDVINPPLIPAVDGGSRVDRAHVQTDTNNFAPRFGLAYQLRSGTVIRTGYGLFYGTWDPPGGGKLLMSNPPLEFRNWRTTDGIHPDVRLESGFPNSPVSPDFDPSAATNMSVSNIQRDRTWPLAQQWNFNIQQTIARDWMIEVGYFGAKASHLVRKYDMNFAPPGPGNINSRRRWQSITLPDSGTQITPLGEVFRHQFDGDSQFHSGQLKIKRRFSEGLSVLGSYVYSRNIDDVCAEGGGGTTGGCGEPQDSLDFRANKGLSSMHLKHQFVGSVIYDLPWGNGRAYGANWHPALNAVLGNWTVASIVTLKSGLPISPTVQGNPANTNTTNRPDVVGDPILDRSDRTLQRWFDTSALVRNQPFQFGNAGRNILFEPRTTNWDFAVYKRFPITESKIIQFRFESFNFTNTPQFGAPNAQVGNRNFGQISGAARPRNLQFGLKFIF